MKNRILSYDLIRVFAIVAVVATHTENITSSTTNYLGGISWWFANTIHSLVMISVPLFVMLSGALVLNKENLTSQYLSSKIIKKFLVPLIFWWLFYSFWNSWQAQTIITFSTIQALLINLFKVNIGHLYFLPVIIGLYLLAPIIRKSIINNQSKQYQSLAVIVSLSLLYQSLTFFVFKLYNATNIFFIAIPFLAYFLLGYYLAKLKISLKQWWFVFLVSLIIVGIVSVATYYNTLAFNQELTVFWTPAGGNFFWQPFTIFAILLASFVFILLNNIQVILPKLFQSKITCSWLIFFSNLSFGIYLVHPFVIDRIDHFFNLAIHLTSLPLWFYYLYRTAVILVFSTVVVAIIQKIPYLRKIFGVGEKSVEKK